MFITIQLIDHTWVRLNKTLVISIEPHPVDHSIITMANGKVFVALKPLSAMEKLFN